MSEMTQPTTLNDLLSQLMNISEQTLDDHTQQRLSEIILNRKSHQVEKL